MTYLILIISLTTENTSIRMRVWRAVKASGAAVLRDGVYLLPNQEFCLNAFTAISADLQNHGGITQLLGCEALDDADFKPLFDRTPAYTALLAELEAFSKQLDHSQQSQKTLRKLQKQFAAITESDFFPGEAQNQVAAAIQALEAKLRQLLSPDEPQPQDNAISQLAIADFQGKHWATRQRPCVDRLASAWLIRRFIDPNAEFIWLAAISDCPAHALGFDFDGARFSHSGNKVTFEVLLQSFSLTQPGLPALAALVHFLDVGGIQPAEAIGVEAVLVGLRNSLNDDQQLLDAACMVFDSLLTAFATGVKPHE